MAKKGCTRRELLDRWSAIQAEVEEDDPSPSRERRILRAKEEWFSDSFNFLINLPVENHIWCDFSDIMGPLLETFHNYFKDRNCESPLKLLWKRISRELRHCTQCICQHHQAQEYFNVEYETDSVDPLLTALRCLDEERITQHLKDINARIRCKEYNPESHGAEVVSVMFEVLMFPLLLDDQSLANEFQFFIESVDESHEVTLSSNQQYPGIYALLFLKSGRARAVGFRLAGCMGKLRRATDLEPLQPLLRKYIGFLEAEDLPPISDMLRPRVQLERMNVWNGFKTLLGFLEAEALEDGILEKYPIFLSIVLNHVSDDTTEFSFAVACLRTLFEMLGCKLWLRTTLSPSMMRNSLLGQCFHTRNEKSHKDIFDLFLPFLQSLESLQDGEHEKQRRHFLYFLLHQVTQSRNFSNLMRKNASKIAILIIHRGYTMSPPCPPSECAHMWGPSLVSSLKDSSLHSSLRQPAFDLINTIIVSDASALMSLKLKCNASSNICTNTLQVLIDDEDEQLFFDDVEENVNSCWSEFGTQNKLTSFECTEWACIPLLWFEVLTKIDPSMLLISFSKAVFWALSHISLLESGSSMELSSSVEEWMSLNAREISSSFGWEVPTGTDDGGDGRECRNSVRASSRTVLLTKILKRLAAHFVLQIEQHELQKQWTWEPKMAESLILLIIDPDDRIRQADRVILEHVSRTQGLTSGLQFLCSSASSLSAVFSGLRYALQQVPVDSIVANFHNLHHLFFVLRKLLKEVVTSNQISYKEDSKSTNYLSAGGFLQQLNFGHLSDGPPESSGTIVDMKSWEKFSCFLSAIVWPSIAKCLADGKQLVSNKNCQMTCVRLLETLPVVYERLNCSSSKMSGYLSCLTYDILDLKWFSDLVEWGSSSLIVVTRHWKQCMLVLLNYLKSSHIIKASCNIGAIEAIMSHATVAVDMLKEEIRQLKISFSEEVSLSDEHKIQMEKLLLPEPLSGKKTPAPDVNVYDNKVYAGSTLPPQKVRNDNVIVLSDDEIEKTASSDIVSTVMSSSHHKLIDTTRPSKDNQEDLSSRISLSNSQFSSQRPVNDMRGDNISSKVELDVCESTSLIPAKSIGKSKGASQSFITSETISSLKKAKSSGQVVKVSAQNLSPELEKNDAIIKELIRGDDDFLERALDRSRRSKLLPTKQNISGPKRQVMQLQLPTKNKSGPLNRQELGVRRLKPPKLDDWYRPILELDYFALIGLTSSTGDIKSSTKLKEVPLCFQSSNHYVDIFRPLVLEEFKAQLHSSYIETSGDGICCNSLCILSVERVDDFHLIRGCFDVTESIASRMCIENDLVLLTKEPLQNAAQHVHVLGKVERREKSDKNRSMVLIIRIYLPNNSPRFNKVRRLLTERSKWFSSRIMSITPQLREFQALSSLNEIPMLPIILNPVNHSDGYSVSKKAKLDRLSQSMQDMLISSYNNSQLQAISIAIGSPESFKKFELSLIQGPPGTGKTRTIVAILSAWLALHRVHKNSCFKSPSTNSMRDSNESGYSKKPVSQSVAIARAWQDAAFANQLIKDTMKDPSAPLVRQPRGRILICAQSNAAVDELVSRISEGLYGSDGKTYKPYLVRVGNSKTVHPCSLPFFIDTLVEHRLAEEISNLNGRENDKDAESSNSLRGKLEKVVENIRYYESKRAKIDENEMSNKNSVDAKTSKKGDPLEMSDAAIGAKLNILYGQKKSLSADLAVAHAREKKVFEEGRSLRHKIRKSILTEAEIVVTTLSGCGGDIYGVCSESASSNRFGNFSEQNLFDVVIIDEAAQALEPATLIPLQLLKSNGTKCIMVGDPKQLPATVISNVASKFLYECSMFERLQKAGHPVIMLNEQYRMHPEICRFPSMHFYENKLLNGEKMANRSASFHENYCLSPYMFFDIADGQEHHGKNSGSVSLFNEAEVQAAVEILKFLKKRYPSEFLSRRIGIVTPYRSQLSLLRSRFSTAFGSEVISDIEFNTIDGFQGREVDILVLSTVRASGSTSEPPRFNSNSIGFVADVRRMNVALTRAKFSLWIVGNARTLQTNVNWAALIENSKGRDLFMSVKKPYRSIFPKTLFSSGQNLCFSKLDSRSSSVKHNERVKNAMCEIEYATTDAKTGHKKHKTSRNLDTHAKNNSLVTHLGCSDTKSLASNSVPVAESPSQSYECSNDTTSSMKASRKNERKKKHQKQCKDSSDSGKKAKEEPTCDRIEEKTVCLEIDSSIGSSVKKAKAARRFSEHPRSSSSCQNSTSPSSKEANQGTRKNRSSDIQEPKDLIARRKRQREDIEALLPSALISSKKPGDSSKLASVKRPHSNKAVKGISGPER
ncbi:hypothetical protein Cni_G05052 [Canna indica]|uniref:P-loop containing nucleoside triphosphate hydrolases superfamily protein n=1 Tax=Canna indica TaxID=4628 RepID=A0AAQ3Q2U1_9LILI|nr:hypothetical protein Cni_G05052 [Canna indica]